MLKMVKNKLISESYKCRAVTDHPVHNKHRKIRKKYGEAIRRAKQKH